VTEELEILRDITTRLDCLRLPFMLTGSVAMNHYAVPRMTRDIDLVILLPAGRVHSFVRSLEPDYMIAEEAVVSAVGHSSMFNAIHMESVVKVDFVCLKEHPFRHEEFARRRRVKIDGFETWIVSREDLILSKLLWARDSGSERQHADIRNLLGDACDMAYLEQWAPRLGVDEDFEKLRSA
jgi:hypothetical protein